MPEQHDVTPAADAATNRRWKRLTPLLLILVGFGAGVIASHLAMSGRMHRRSAGEHRIEHRERSGSDGRSDRRGGERTERARSRGRDASDGEQRSRRFRNQLVRRLGLDEDQQAQMDAFVEANRAEASAFWDDTYARYGELRQRFREQIREILTDEQRQAFDAMLSERERNGGDDDSVEGSAEGTTPEGGTR